MSVTIGKLIQEEAKRDAIHVAVLPLTAGEDMWRGNKVRLSLNDKTIALHGEYNMEAIGIVDPFLEDAQVDKGQKFWCFLFPETVQGMRHHWYLPLIDDPAPYKTKSEKWLSNFADKYNFDYSDMIYNALQSIQEGKEYGDYWVTARGNDLYGRQELDEGEFQLFWYHIGIINGNPVPEEAKHKLVWSCSC